MNMSVAEYVSLEGELWNDVFKRAQTFLQKLINKYLFHSSSFDKIKDTENSSKTKRGERKIVISETKKTKISKSSILIFVYLK
jgi:hypothetical protein